MSDVVAPFAEAAGRAIELAGVATIVAGGVWAVAVTVTSVVRRRRGEGPRSGPYWKFRSTFARAILLGLEILIAADIILTVTLDRTIESAVALGIIVLVRIALSWSLTVEIDGHWPWQPAGGAAAESAPDEV